MTLPEPYYDADGVTVYCADALDVLPCLRERATLLYADPPFATGREWRDAEGRGFDDRRPLDAHLDWMAPRVEAMRDVLAPSGVLVVHCDDRTSHYLRCMLADLLPVEVGPVVWARGGGGRPTDRYARAHDTLLVFAASDGHRWTPPVGIEPTDLWDDIRGAPPTSERTGWPTQKPERLLERLILTFTAPGDLVADPFCGSGTTLAVAQRLGRRALGCDISADAVAVAAGRLRAVVPDAQGVLDLGGAA